MDPNRNLTIIWGVGIELDLTVKPRGIYNQNRDILYIKHMTYNIYSIYIYNMDLT